MISPDQCGTGACGVALMTKLHDSRRDRVYIAAAELGAPGDSVCGERHQEEGNQPTWQGEI